MSAPRPKVDKPPATEMLGIPFRRWDAAIVGLGLVAVAVVLLLT